MNWEAIGAIGEIVGAIAVVVTLLILIFQLRHHTTSTKMANRTTAMEAYSSILSTTQDDVFAECAVRGMEDYYGLSPTEQLRFSSWIHRQLRLWENSYFQWKEDQLDESAWQAITVQMFDALSIDGIRIIFELRKTWLDERFVSFTEAGLKKSNRSTDFTFLNEGGKSAKET